MNYPVFLRLAKKKVLVIGAGDVAERKIQALLASDAEILLLAKKINKNIQNLIDNKQIIYLGQDFKEEFIDDVFFIISATDDREFNQKISQIAEKKAKFCNCVDDLDNSSLILGANLNRGKLQIAVSSSGISPVFARIIRDKLELFLPNYLENCLDILAKYREKIKNKFNNIQIRRLFFEKMLENAKFHYLVENNLLKEAEELLATEIKNNNENGKKFGEVVLVGAGPGNPDLLTIKALRAIKSADVVLTDALVSKEILEIVRRDAKIIFVGKRAGNHFVVQERINQLMVEYAQEGNKVVRLKGGDPFIFGRGGEECEFLRENNIPFSIIPGITAAIGISANTLIPLTHRNYSQNLFFLTAQTETNQINWKNIAEINQTIVFYMGKNQAENIQNQLIKYGKSAKTPCAIISNGTLSNEKVIMTNLDNLAKEAKTAARPALIIIGEVVKIREKLRQ
ncbi:MAG: uroporphyrinogen-III C-methyltransferase [Cardiobacteriaceae bacterium]|nr:uroporphyrinogen-III C-methyltransferase [Cardiobacteriaceae bacterium]